MEADSNPPSHNFLSVLFYYLICSRSEEGDDEQDTPVISHTWEHECHVIPLFSNTPKMDQMT